MTKPALLFATARSGSTPVYMLLERYFDQTRGLVGLGEFLNPLCQKFEERDGLLYKGQFIHESGKKCAPSNDRNERLEEKRARLQRIQMLKRHKMPHFLKVFPEHILEEYEDWLCREFDWIFLERQDLYSQFLSYAISFYTGFWYEDGGLKIAENSVRVDRWCVKIFENSIWNYMSFKTRIQPRHVLYYEDFCKNSPADFLRRSNFDEPLAAGDYPFTAIQNQQPKERVIQNLNEVQKWYSETFLHQISPI